RVAFDRLMYSEEPPSEEAVFALGKELQDAGLRELIYGVIEGKHIASSTLRGLLYAAARLNDSRISPEEHACVDDEGHVRRLLAEIRTHARWPEVRPELVKFSKRCYVELAERTPPEPPAAEQSGRMGISHLSKVPYSSLLEAIASLRSTIANPETVRKPDEGDLVPAYLIRREAGKVLSLLC